MRKVPLVGVEIRVKGGRSHGDLKKIKTCNYCKLKGHIKKDCWKRKKKNASNDGAKDTTSNANASYVNDSGVLVDKSTKIVINGFLTRGAYFT